MADESFVKIPYSELSAELKANMEAAGVGNPTVAPMTGEEYYNSRGGINKAGYWADFYTPGLTLTDEEYFAAIKGTKPGMLTGSSVNAAAQAKAFKYYASLGYDAEQTSRLMAGTARIIDGKYYSVGSVGGSTGQFTVAGITSTGTNTSNQNAAAEAAKKEKVENAISVLTARFSQYNLQSLVPKIRELAIGGASEATITLQLQETEEYRQRFKANQDRIKKGLAVLDPGEYIGLEDKYRQILRAYGLKQFDNDNYVSQFISNDISTAELSSRVQTAVQRVQNADPAILKTLTKFYGISSTDLVGYVLDPEQQFQKIERQVAAAEIGAAAGLQGIQTGVSVAEQLAAQGITQAQAQKGYATIADILPTSEKLSQIYGGTLDTYGLAEAEQDVFNTLASAQRKRRKLAEREVAEFSGSSGVSRASINQQIGGQF